MLDAQDNALEARVHKRLAEAQPVDLSDFSQELMKFKANLIASLVAPIPVFESTLADELLFDMFEKYPLCAPKKRSMEETNTEDGHTRQKTSNEELDEQITKLVLKTSREEAELRKAQELEKLQDVCSSSMAAVQTTPQEGDFYVQLEAGAQAPFVI